MSVAIRQALRNSFGTAVPVLTPLYNADCDSWQIADEGEFHCGNSDHCQLPLRLDGIEKQHCSLLFRSGALRIRRDNGRIWVNDLPVAGECDLAPGDILNIGPVSFEVGQIVRPHEILQPVAAQVSTPETRQPFETVPSASRQQLQKLAEVIQEREQALAERRQTIEERSALLNEQKAAIVSEREASLKARHEAVEFAAETRAAKAALEIQASRLQAWQAEIDSRHAELARHVIAVKSLRNAQQAADSVSGSEQTSGLRAEWQLLSERQAEVAAAEARLNELQAAARSMLHAAETERDALQNSHKDLLCERNSLVQLRQDVHSRESGLHEREHIVGRQTEDLRSRFEASTQQAAALQKLEGELNSRAAELHRLETEQQQHVPVAERDALLTAVRELQTALQNARSDVEEAGRIRAKSAHQEQTLSQLYQTIEDCGTQLQLKESQLRQTLEQLEALQAQVSKLTQECDELVRQSVASDAVPESDSADETELQLFSQIESLRNELQQSASSDTARLSQFQNTLAERDQWIHDLQNEVESLRAQQAQEAHAAAVDGEKRQQEARELDRREALLDQREEELRERSQRIDQSEEEVELKRHELLDARQQLELARAEIQLAMKQHSAATLNPAAEESCARSETCRDESTREGEGEDFGDSPLAFDSTVAVPPSADCADTPHDLRHELAGLFGHQQPLAESVPAPTLSIADFVDLSEPAGESKAVAFRFGEDASSFIFGIPSDAAAAGPIEPAREENSDDFVRDYMEQLLARSRKSAGNVLPDELKSAELRENAPKSAPIVDLPKKSAAATSQKQPPRVKSYIDQYMSGGFGDLTGDGSITAQPEKPPAAVFAAIDTKSVEPLQPRAKIDLQKMRENMNSFRTLATQSVENALVDHAIRKERHNLMGRIIFALAMVSISVLLAICSATGITVNPSLTWVTLVAVIAAATELVRRVYGRETRRKGVLVPGDAARDCDETVAVDQGAKMLLGSTNAALESSETQRPSVDARAEQPQIDSANRPWALTVQEEERAGRYFEL